MRIRSNRFATALCVAILLCSASWVAYGQSGKASGIPAADLIQPSELAQTLKSPTDEKPLVLQVGSHILFAEAHIPGAEYAGAAAQEEGLRALKERASKLDRARFVVIYCGCCPWSKCPNIWPAYQQMKSLGFTHLKVLYVADNFGTDWVDKGYPVAKGR